MAHRERFPLPTHSGSSLNWVPVHGGTEFQLGTSSENL